MNFLRFLTAFTAALVFSSAAYAKPSIQMNANHDGSHNITMLLDSNQTLGIRFAHALIKSPLVKEVVNIYVPPKTIYQGDGFQLNLKPSGSPAFIEFTIRIAAEDRANMSIQGEYFHAGAIGGALHALHLALLHSESPNTVTKARPGLLNPQDGEVFVLQGVSFGDPSIGCRPHNTISDFSMCTFELKK